MRLAWIDALKGFGILLVVFAHYMLPQALDTYIFSFHMPLFFFVSGFLFNFAKYSGSAANFIKGRCRSLIIPYFAFAVITLLFYFLLDELYTPEVVSFKIFGADIFHVVYSIIFAQTTMISYNGTPLVPNLSFCNRVTFFWASEKIFLAACETWNLAYHGWNHRVPLFRLCSFQTALERGCCTYRCCLLRNRKFI